MVAPKTARYPHRSIVVAVRGWILLTVRLWIVAMFPFSTLRILAISLWTSLFNVGFPLSQYHSKINSNKAIFLRWVLVPNKMFQ